MQVYRGDVDMAFLFFIIFYIIIGIIMAKVVRFIGSKIFKFSDIYKSFLKLFKKEKCQWFMLKIKTSLLILHGVKLSSWVYHNNNHGDKQYITLIVINHLCF